MRNGLLRSTVSGKVTKQGRPSQDQGHKDGAQVLGLKAESPIHFLKKFFNVYF